LQLGESAHIARKGAFNTFESQFILFRCSFHAAARRARVRLLRTRHQIA
jgi:hypothetical protein